MAMPAALPDQDQGVMRQRSKLRTFCVVALWIGCLGIGSRDGHATLSVGQALDVKILYDNSGSMYPGYAPPGREGVHRSVSGARFFYEYPEFQAWLSDFVSRQTILDGQTLSMWICTSGQDFRPSDLRQVHPRVRVAEFDVARILGPGKLNPSEWGENTYLTESLRQLTRNFEGLVWLITDNIVETQRGEPSADVLQFFETLKDEQRYRSVHLFKYPFQDAGSGQRANLAVYGILVSDSAVAPNVLAYYDRKFRNQFLNAARRRSPAKLFPGQEHLKLKDLSIDAIELVPNLEVTLEGPDGSVKEGQVVRFDLRGQIRSHLTQHSVTGGRYTLLPLTPFEPEAWAKRDLDARPLAPQIFPMVSREIRETIAPNGSRDLAETIRSNQPISFSPHGLGAWLRLAIHGAAVQYTGRFQMSFEGVRVRLERARMEGIFGADQAPRVFDFQDVQTIPVAPSEASVSFVLKTGYSRTAWILLLLAILAVPLVLALLILRRKAWYRILITGTPERLIGLRRWGGIDITHEGRRLGRLSRALSGRHEFIAVQGNAALAVTPARENGTFDVRLRDGVGYQLRIETKDGRAPGPSDGPSGSHRDDFLPRDRPGAPGPGAPGGASGGPAGNAPTGTQRPRPRIERPG